MSVVGLSGPNAIGKTTALRRWAIRYPRLLACLADCQRECNASDWDKATSSPPNVRSWKGISSDKEVLVKAHRLANHVAVIDSARTTALNYLIEGEYIILVTCSWKTMEHNLRERCESSGFEVEDRERDWPAVDAYFTKIYRGLHNQLVRRVL